MHRNGLHLRKWRYLALFFLIFINAPYLFAQKKQTFEGPFTLNNDSVTGTARFEYLIEKRDTLFDGPFNFQRVQILESSGQRMKVGALDLSGTFERGKKSGDWQYAFKQLTPGRNLRVSSFDVSYPANGNTLIVSAKFQQGLPNGTWQYVRKTVNEGTPKDTLSQGKITFENGVITGKIQLEDFSTKLKGQYSAGGLVDGEWQWDHLSDSLAQKETRTYNSGWLTAHQLVLGGKTFTLNHRWHLAPDSNGQEVVVPLRETYNQILRLAARAVVTDLNFESDFGLQLKAAINTNSEFLLNHLFDFQQDEGFSIWNSFEKDGVPMDFGRIRVNKYPKSQSERDTIKWALDVIASLQDQITSFFDNPFAEIGRYNYEGLASTYAIYAVYREAVAEYQKINRLLKEPALEYFPRAEIMPYLIPDFQYPDSISFEYDGQKRSLEHSFPSKLIGKQKAPDRLWKHLAQLQEDLNTIGKQADRLLDIARKESALGDLEAELVRTRDSVQRVFSGALKNYNPYHKNLSRAVLQLTETAFQDYMKREVEQKKETIDDAIQCHEDLLKVYKALSDLPRKLTRLDEEYTRTVWNAYLMVDMDERVKERVYNAVIDYALPYLVKRQVENLSCQSALEDVQLLQQVYDRMLALRNEDTRDLEKRLRREKNPVTILKVIGVEIHKD